MVTGAFYCVYINIHKLQIYIVYSGLINKYCIEDPLILNVYIEVEIDSQCRIYCKHIVYSNKHKTKADLALIDGVFYCIV